MALPFMPFCRRKIFHLLFFWAIFLPYIYKLARTPRQPYAKYSTCKTQNQKLVIERHIRYASQIEQSTWRYRRKKNYFRNFHHHAFSIHQRLSWNKTERATCYKMLVCHKIHWIIVAVIVAKNWSSLRFIYSIHKFISMCKWAQHFASVIASMMRFFAMPFWRIRLKNVYLACFEHICCFVAIAVNASIYLQHAWRSVCFNRMYEWKNSVYESSRPRNLGGVYYYS